MTALILDHLWQSTLFALAAGLLTLAFRRNRAGVRYAIWFAASLKFLVPFAVLARAASATMGALAPHISAPALQPVQTFAEPFSYVAPAAGAAVAASPATGPIVPILAVESLWAAGLIAILAIWIWRWSSLRLLLRTAQPSPVNAPVPVKSSAGFVEPGLFGVVHPVILLPEGIERVLTAEEMQAVIDHEVCHLRRRDNLTAAIHMAVQALFWFHPLVWWIGERLVAEREAACDEAVVEGGADPKVYADGILKVCRHYLNSPLPCMAGISGADLKARIAAIMQSPLAAGLGKTRKLLLGASAAATLIAPLVLGLSASPLTALAQAPASIQSAIGAALGAPAQPKLAAPFAAPSVAPGGGAANAAAIEAALKQYLAVASDDYPGQTAMIGRMIELGATAPQILAFREQFSIAAGGKARSNIDMSNARFVRVDDERIAVAEPILRDGRISAWSYAGGWPAIPPGGLDSLASASFLGDLPLHWQAPYWATIDQMLNAGGNGSEAARLLLAQEDLPDGDASSARFVQSPSGAGAALAIRFNPAEPPVVITLRDTESYPGLASLPSVIQALPVAPMPPSPGKPLPEIPATWLTQASKMSRYLTLSNPSGISGANLKRRIGAIMGGQPLHRLDHAKKVLLGACGIAALAAPLALGLAASPLSVLAQAPAPGHNVTVTALGAPTQAKVAAAPPILSVKPGSGGEPADSSRELALAAAIASQDERDIVRYGGTAQQVATAILSHTKTNPPMDASTARFIFQDGILRVVMSSSDGRSRLHQPLGDVTPPGGVADLPTTADEAGLISIESAFGPPQARAPSASDPGRLMPTIPTKAP